MRSLKAHFQLAHTVVSRYQHSLRCFASRPALRTNVVSGSKAQRFTVPERRVVTRVIVGVAAENIKDQTGKQFSQGVLRAAEAMTNNFRKCLVAGVTRHHVIQAKE